MAAQSAHACASVVQFQRAALVAKLRTSSWQAATGAPVQAEAASQYACPASSIEAVDAPLPHAATRRPPHTNSPHQVERMGRFIGQGQAGSKDPIAVMYAAPMARADLVHSLGLDAVRAALIRRAAAWMARQRRRIAGEGRWQEGWPRTGWGLLVDAGLAEAGDDEVTTPIAAPDLGPRLGPVCTRLGLAPAAAEFLAGLVVAAIDVEVARVWHALAPVPSAPAYTFGAWIEVLGDDDERRQALLAVLSPDHPLRRLRIVELGDGPPWAAPIAAVPEALVGLTVGAPVHAPIPAITDVVLTEAELGQLGQLAASAPRRVVFVGRTGSGRRTRAALLASRLGRAASAIHGADPAVLAARLRDALFADAVPVVQLAADASPAWWHQLASFEGALILVADPAAAGDLLRRLAGTVEVTIAPLSAAAQRRLWTQRLAGASEPVDDTVLDTVVAAYDLPPGDVDHLAQRLRSAGRRIGVVDVRDALRSASTTELWGLAQPYRTVHTWADVILPDSTQHLLTELIAHLRHRATVFESWGFGRKVDYGRSLSALFYGPPGTGKTMVAGIIANDFGRELYRVDLSRVVDKYVGETEKNLRRVFEEAKKTQALLLFDEADALFAKRTRVESSNDRYANLAVNFLLQEMEQFDGCCLLTTNLDSGLDEAFRRRLRFRIEFPRPTEDERARLWPSMVPAGAPLADDVDWAPLVDEFDRMTGAHIKNAVVRAAFLAADAGGPITQALLRQAARAEYEETGHVAGRA